LSAPWAKRRRGSVALHFLEGESEAQVKRPEVVIFSWGWVDSVVDANRPDGQVVTQPESDTCAEILKGGRSEATSVEEDRANDSPEDREIVLDIENGAGKAANRVIANVLRTEFALRKTSHGRSAAVKKSLLDWNREKSALRWENGSETNASRQNGRTDREVGGKPLNEG